MKRVKSIAVIGATGSVGGAILDVCGRFPDRFKVIALAAKSSRGKLVELGRQFNVKALCLTGARNFNVDGFDCFSGTEGLSELIRNLCVDQVVFAASGTDTIYALMETIKDRREISISNKEMIVAAGNYIMPLLKYDDQLIPVDSEHNAVWQCLRGEKHSDIRKIWLTASGGPFRNFSAEEMRSVTPEMALNHPIWSMGAKITVDSATMMNKGLECIEAMRLFNLEYEQVGALIHPSSQAHGMALMGDGTMKMLIAPPDMRIPCSSALAYPERLDMIDTGTGGLIPEQLDLSFSPIDEDRFPCFRLAMQAAKKGGAYPPLLVGADEAAVSAFLQGKIAFTQIPEVIESVFDGWDGAAPGNENDAIALIGEGERLAGKACGLDKRV